MHGPLNVKFFPETHHAIRSYTKGQEVKVQAFTTLSLDQNAGAEAKVNPIEKTQFTRFRN
jgi:hypothetical protein